MKTSDQIFANGSRGVTMLAVLAVGLLTGSGAMGAKTWSGAAGNFWSNPGNWVEGAAPVNGDALVFPSSAVTKQSTNDLGFDLNVRSISFSGGGYLIGTNAGNTHVVIIGTGFSTFMTNSGANFFNVPLRLNNSVTLTNLSGSYSNLGPIDLNGQTLTLQPANSINVNGVISGNGSVITDRGIGSVTYRALMTYGGDTVINPGGVFNISQSQIFPAGPGKGIVVNNGTVWFNNSSFHVINGLGGSGIFSPVNGKHYPCYLVVGSNDVSSVFDGKIQEPDPANCPVNLTKTGLGTLVLTKANSFFGTNRLQAGVEQIGDSLTLQSTLVNLATLDSGSLAFSNLTQVSIGALMGTRGLALANEQQQAVDLSLGRALPNGVQSATNGNLSLVSNYYAGVLSGPGSLTKVGTNVQTLAGINTFSGNTIVSSGTLALTGSGALASPVISVYAGGTLSVSGVTGGFKLASGQRLTGNGSVSGAVSANGGAWVCPGLNQSVGTLTIKSNVTLSSGATLWIKLDRTNAAQNCDQLAVVGTLTRGGSLVVTNIGAEPQPGDVFDLFNVAGFAGAFEAVTLPPLAEGLAWNTDSLAVDGTISVTVPLAKPAIGSQPVSQNSLVGGTASFSITAVGAAPITYQWYKDGTPIAGATNASYNLLSLMLSDAGSYQCLASNSYGSTNSSAATLLVLNVMGPADLTFIPAGTFTMGDTMGDGNTDEFPSHSVYVSGFFIGKDEVSKPLWDDVYSWAITHGYSFYASGTSRGTNYPVCNLRWYDAIKWCNARSEKEGLVPAYYTDAGHTQVYRTGETNLQNALVIWNSGYRLPTEAEWEKAARGGVSGQRFPWGNTISHSQANYFSTNSFSYDVSPTSGFHPAYSSGSSFFISPSESFAPNGYGLYDVAGNVVEWCWDWYDSSWYQSAGATQSDPRGPASGSYRCQRGGGWGRTSSYERNADRAYNSPLTSGTYFGFRCALGYSPTAATNNSVLTWAGTLGSSWNNAGNWVENAVPANGNALVFPPSPLAAKTTNDLASDLSVRSLSIGAGSYVIGLSASNPYRLYLGDGGQGGITNAGSNILSVPLVLNNTVALKNASGNFSNLSSIDLNGQTLTLQAAGGYISLNGVVSNSGSVVIDKGASVVQFRASMTYSGDTVINAGGTLNIVYPTIFPAGTGKGIVVNNGAITFNNSSTHHINGLSGSGTLVPSSGRTTQSYLIIGTNNASSVFDGAFLTEPDPANCALNVTKIGSGTFVLTKPSGYYGTNRVIAGTERIGDPLALQNALASVNTSDTGVMVFSNLTRVNLGALSGSRGLSLVNEQGQPLALMLGRSLPAGRQVATNGTLNIASNYYAGPIAGAGSLTKIGTNLQLLAGINTFTGPTTVSNGTLALTGNGSLASPVITVVSGGTLSVGSVSGGFAVANGQTLQGNGTIDGDTTVSPGGMLSPGLGTAFGTLSVKGNVTLAGGSAVTLRLSRANAARTSDELSLTGVLTCGGTLIVTNVGDILLPGDTFDLFDAAGFAGGFAAIQLPPLDAGQSWDISNLGVNGTISVQGVLGAPVIGQQPVSQTNVLGGTASFSIMAIGSAPLAYQWYKDGAAIANATNASVSLPNLAAQDAGSYWCKVENGQGAVSSRAAKLALVSFQVPNDLVAIPAGSFVMGDTMGDGSTDELPAHTVFISAFFLGRDEVRKSLWDEVYNWAIAHGYDFDRSGTSKGDNYPVCNLRWWDAVKWCNARSEKEGLLPAYYTDAGHTQVYRNGEVDIQNAWVIWNAGYRLPTEAEYEKAARGGVSGQRFPWGNTISHSQANYFSMNTYSYDVSPTRGYNPLFSSSSPYINPAEYFAPNGYGLYDIAGNAVEWCWDWYDSGWYQNAAASQDDPRGPTSGTYRCQRGGGWGRTSSYERNADRAYNSPLTSGTYFGFRCALGLAVTVITNGAPAFTVQPQSQTNDVGTAAAFSVAASGAAPLAYQWFKDGVALPNQTGFALNLPAVALGDAGNYYAVAANACGSATSQVAVLTVNSGPSLTFVVGQTNAAEQAELVVPVTVRGLNNMLAFQFSLHWDPAVVQFVGVEQFGVPGMSAGNFSTGDISEGTLRVSWDDPEGLGKSVADGTTVFGLRLRLIGSAGSASAITINGTPLPMEAADRSYSVVPVKALPGGVSIGRTTVVLQAGRVAGLEQAVVAVPIQASRFTNIIGLQLSLHWDPAVAQWAGVEQFGLPGLASGSFGTLDVTNGTLRFTWDDLEAIGKTVPDGSTLFALRLRLIGAAGASCAVTLDGVPLPLEAADSAYHPVDVRVAAGRVDVLQPVVITGQPQSLVRTNGDLAELTVVASGTAPLSYQWFKGNSAVANANGATLSLGPLGLGDAGNYWAVVSNAINTATSQVATVAVWAPVAITQQPQGTMHGGSGSATFTVAASGFPAPAYQWRFNGLPLENETSPALTLSGITPENAGQYDVVVSNPMNVVTSQVAVLVVYVTISGKVAYYNQAAAGAGVVVNLTGSTNLSTVTAEDGSYSFTVSAGGNYTVTPARGDDSPLINGVSTLDISLLRRHILGFGALDSPYKLLAGDVDGSGSLSTVGDVSRVRRLILGMTNTFPLGLWRFVPAKQTFGDPANPWNAPASLTFTNLVGDAGSQDFLAMKLGDVNASWLSATATNKPASVRRLPAAGASTVISVSSVTTQLGGEAVVQIRASGFKNVTSLQFTLQWNPAQLRFVSAGDYGLQGLGAGNLGTSQSAQGRVAVSWDDAQGQAVTLADGSLLFTVRFAVIGALGASASVDLGDQVAAREVAVNFAAAPLATQAGTISVEGIARPRLGETGCENGVFHVAVPTAHGLNYVLESRENPQSEWTAVATSPGDGTTQVLSNPTSAESSRFYRVRVE